MATSKQGNSGAYGLYNPIQTIAPLPIIAKRDPSSSDKAEIGTMWINTTTDTYFILTSSGTWSSETTESPTFTDLTVTGTSDLEGDLTVGGASTFNDDVVMNSPLTVNASVDLGVASTSTIDIEGATINIGSSSDSLTLNLGSNDTDSATTIIAGSGGLILNGASGGILLTSNNTTAAAFTATNNSYVGTVTLTGQTITSTSSQALTINNSHITTTRGVLVSVNNLNVSGNGAYLTIEGVTQASGSIVIHATNNSGADLAAADTIIISFIVFN